ncbi:MAG TPA: four helix bundle protein [Dehalococcoidia bacterium]|nr:four helix bundle protein [Dehalococcoidia bacterium]
MTDDIRHQTTDNRVRATGVATTRAHYSFRDLAVWQKAQDLSLHVLQVVRAMPSDRTSAVLTQQILRSATSIAANIAEGHGRFTSPAYRNHLSIARGSANETLSWIDLLARAGYISKEREHELSVRCEEALRMISAQMIALSRPAKSRTDGGEASTRTRRSNV